MLKKIILVLVVLIVAVLGYASTRPDTFQVVRSGSMKAPPEKVHALLNDFHNWPQWSPWEKLDPNMKRTHSGAAAGKGAIYEWEGNKDVGKGRMEITETTPPGKVVIKLDFLVPFEANNITEFTITPGADGTTVNWKMHGPQPFMSKVMCLFMDMDKMIGKDFEEGLRNMKSVVEKADAPKNP